MFGRGRAGGWGDGGVIGEAILAMNLGCVKRRPAWTFAPYCDWNICQPDDVEHSNRVEGSQCSGAIAMDAADSGNLDVRLGRDLKKHEGIVNTGIGVEY